MEPVPSPHFLSLRSHHAWRVAPTARRIAATQAVAESAGPRRRFDPLQLEWVAPSGTLAERKDVQASPRGCDAETA